MQTIKPGRYLHYKGKEYEVLGVALHSETLEQLVIYKANYGNNEIWARPINMWNELVLVGDKKVKRFTYIGEQNAD